MARVVRFHEIGGPDVLKVDQVEIADPRPGDVRINVTAIGLNRVEAMFRSGEFGTPTLPSRIGYEAAGVIEAVGAAVTDFKIGDHVTTIPGLAMETYGTYGDTILYPANMLIRQPDNVSFETAAAAWMQYLTAYALIGVADLKRDDLVVITAASSSVGLAAIEIANLLGAIPIAVTRTASKAARLTAHGARHVVVTEAQDLVETVTALSHGKGARIVFDAVAGGTLSDLAAITMPRGMIIIYGTLGGNTGTLALQPAMMKSLTIRGFAMNDMIADPSLRKAAIAFVIDGLSSGTLRPVIDRVFELKDIGEAHRYLESNAQFGKIVVKAR